MCVDATNQPAFETTNLHIIMQEAVFLVKGMTLDEANHDIQSLVVCSSKYTEQ